jgi:hypothetical protein
MICSGIEEVAGFEIHLRYPMDGLTFIGINSNNLEGSTINSINGQIHLIWEDIFHLITLPDGSEVLSLMFRIQDDAPESILISFISAHVADALGNEIHIITRDGRVLRDPTGLDDGNLNLPGTISLEQNYPNPFNAETRISFNLSSACLAKLEIFDLTGRKITTLENGYLNAGNHGVIWNGRSDDGTALSSGTYFYRLKTDIFNDCKRMLMLK